MGVFLTAAGGLGDVEREAEGVFTDPSRLPEGSSFAAAAAGGPLEVAGLSPGDRGGAAGLESAGFPGDLGTAGADGSGSVGLESDAEGLAGDFGTAGVEEEDSASVGFSTFWKSSEDLESVSATDLTSSSFSFSALVSSVGGSVFSVSALGSSVWTAISAVSALGSSLGASPLASLAAASSFCLFSSGSGRSLFLSLLLR